MLKLIPILVLFVLGGCSTTAPVKHDVAPVAVSVALNKAVTLESDRLNVSVIAFDPGVDPNKGKVTQFHRHLRDAEAGYMPVVLKNTLVDSGHWGAVRVLPETDPTAEVLVVSRILESDAVELRLRISVSDSRGVVWLDKEYFDTATDHAYDPEKSIRLIR